MTALWAASVYVGSFMAASDRVYEVALRLPFWKSLPLRVGLALLLLVLLSVTAAAIALVGPFARWVMDVSSIGSGPLHLWTWAKWPLLIALGLLLFTLLYKYTPQPAPACPPAAATRRRRRRRPAHPPRPPASASTSATSARTTGCTARWEQQSRSSCGPGHEPCPARRRGGQPRAGTAAAGEPGGRKEPRRDRERIIGAHANRRAPAARRRRHR